VANVDLLKRPVLWTPAFTVLCVTVAFGYTHHALLLPTIPLFVDDHGGSALFAGLALLTFSIPSFLVRPYLGRLADTWSAPGVLALGLLLLTLGALFYLPGLMALVFAAAVLRGFGWAGLNTGGYTVLANLTPGSRRGEASGYYTSATASAIVLFPAVALWLIDHPSLGYDAVFMLAIGVSGLAFFSSYLVLGPLSPGPQAAGEAAATAIETSVLPATILNLASNLAFPAVTAFLPLYARSLDVSDVAIFYILAGVGGALVRPVLGGISDTIGRPRLIAGGFLVQILGFGLVMVAQDLAMVVTGGVLAALGNAVNGGATTALAMDLAAPERRGRAMATFSMSFQIGQGFGAIIAGALADIAGLRSMYAGSMALVALGLVLLITRWRSLEAPRLAAAEGTG
jgi:MFS family permease